MKVKKVMNTRYSIIEKDARIKEALARMARENINKLIVVKHKGDKKPYGIITEYDIFYRLSRTKIKKFEPYNTSVASAATTPVETANKEMDLKFVAKNFLTKGYSSMPIVENDEIIGVITKEDIISLLYRYEDLINQPVTLLTTQIKGKIRLFDKLSLALSKFMGTGFSNLVVIDDGVPVGILKVYDVAKTLFTIRKINPTPHWESVVKEIYVAEVMRKDINILTNESSIKEALNIIITTNQHIIPITDNNKAVGLISRSNIIRYMINNKLI